MTTPSNLLVEKQILITVIEHPDCLNDMVDRVLPHHFYSMDHRLIYAVIVDLYKNNKTINEDIVTQAIQQQHPAIDIVGYWIDTYASRYELNRLVSQLLQMAKRRDVIGKLENTIAILAQEKPFEEILEEVDRSLFHISITEVQRKHLSIHLQESFDLLTKRLDGQHLIRTGLRQLDNHIQGFMPGQLVILAARTAIGKTSCALSIAHNIMSVGKRVAFISLEMPAHELVFKSLAIESQLPYGDIIQGRFRGEHNFFMPVVEAASRMEKFPYDIEDSLYSLQDIKSYCRKLKKETDVSCIIIDYLGLVEVSSYKDSKYLQIGEITRACKLLAKELDVTILLLAQLNRKAESREDHRPHLADLRDSGSIEQDADLILLLYREHYYNKEASIYDAEINIAKNRFGPTGTVLIHFEPELMQFRSKEDDYV